MKSSGKPQVQFTAIHVGQFIHGSNKKRVNHAGINYRLHEKSKYRTKNLKNKYHCTAFIQLPFH